MWQPLAEKWQRRPRARVSLVICCSVCAQAHGELTQTQFLASKALQTSGDKKDTDETPGWGLCQS